MYKIKRFFRKLINIFQFTLLALHDEDWDYDYLIELIKFKCEKMRKYFRKSTVISEADAKEIIVGLNRVLWHIECYRDPFRAYEEEFGKFEVEVGHRSEPVGNGCYRMISINKKTGKDLTEEDDKKYLEYCLKVNELENEHFSGIFQTIIDEGRKWWD